MALILPNNYVTKRWIVCSHERSGTHFLMNSLAKNFPPFSSNPWTDIDSQCNFYISENMRRYMGYLAEQNDYNIIKSHHEIWFFHDILKEDIADYFQFFYIFRQPEDVMKSCCKHFNDLNFHAGPKCEEKDFANAEPEGACMRYQWKQYKNMAERWESHVKGWLEDLDDKVRERIIYVRYEDLQNKFEEVITEISKLTEKKTLGTIKKPGKDSFWINKEYLDKKVNPI